MKTILENVIEILLKVSPRSHINFELFYNSFTSWTSFLMERESFVLRSMESFLVLADIDRILSLIGW